MANDGRNHHAFRDGSNYRRRHDSGRLTQRDKSEDSCGPCSRPKIHNSRGLEYSSGSRSNLHFRRLREESGNRKKVCQDCFENPHEEHQDNHRWREGSSSYERKDDKPESVSGQSRSHYDKSVERNDDRPDRSEPLGGQSRSHDESRRSRFESHSLKREEKQRSGSYCSNCKHRPDSPAETHDHSRRRDTASSQEDSRAVVTFREGGNFSSFSDRGREEFDFSSEGSSHRVKVGCIDMPSEIFERVLAFTIRYETDEPVLWAREVKREMDKIYEPIWNVFIGGDYGVFTHYQKSLFAHFWVHDTEVIVFKTFGIEN